MSTCRNEVTFHGQFEEKAGANDVARMKNTHAPTKGTMDRPMLTSIEYANRHRPRRKRNSASWMRRGRTARLQ